MWISSLGGKDRGDHEDQGQTDGQKAQAVEPARLSRVLDRGVLVGFQVPAEKDAGQEDVRLIPPAVEVRHDHDVRSDVDERRRRSEPEEDRPYRHASYPPRSSSFRLFQGPGRLQAFVEVALAEALPAGQVLEMEMQRDDLRKDGVGERGQPDAGPAVVVDHEREGLPVGGLAGPFLDEIGHGVAVHRPVKDLGVHGRGLPDGAQEARVADGEQIVHPFSLAGRLQVLGQLEDALAEVPASAPGRRGRYDENDQAVQEVETRLGRCGRRLSRGGKRGDGQGGGCDQSHELDALLHIVLLSRYLILSTESSQSSVLSLFLMT
ncbi:MAG: hypothetical protein MZV63_13605 [Marinilabiliales bacterium]|nr:hypothetical protein [Marinilabiliales bacterium]